MAGKKTTVTVGLSTVGINRSISVQNVDDSKKTPTQNFNLNDKINAYNNTPGKSNHNWIG